MNAYGVLNTRGHLVHAVPRRGHGRSGRALKKKGAIMYEPSRNLMNFYVAGFQHHEGALVLSQLKTGDELTLEAQPDNPYDSQAIAIKGRGEMLGYVPADQNGMLSVLFHYGHASIFECRVMQVAPENEPWKQLRVAIFVKDAR